MTRAQGRAGLSALWAPCAQHGRRGGGREGPEPCVSERRGVHSDRAFEQRAEQQASEDTPESAPPFLCLTSPVPVLPVTRNNRENDSPECAAQGPTHGVEREAAGAPAGRRWQEVPSGRPSCLGSELLPRQFRAGVYGVGC